AQRFAQLGTWEGELRVGGTTHAVDRDTWVGSRDRSWGIRPSGESEPAGRGADEPLEGFWWLYLPLRFDDFAIGAYLADPGSTMDAGATSVVFGDDSGWTTNFPIGSLNGSNGFTITGIGSLDWSGYSVSDAGDVNGDGIDDMLVGAPYAGLYGETYLIFGKTSGWTQTLDLSTLNGTNGVRLIGYAGSTGHSVSGAGDINGDGYADIVIGAPDGKAPGGNAGISQAGLSFVVFGKSLGWTSTLAL
ncbi:MAG: FG-GAP repeat protein, partial [Mycobacterium sp.]|nr:FG-GAP repeat protein [Mycobacterium sp.]